MFYVVVGRVTSTVVDAVTGVLSGVSASAVGFGVAAFVWFVFLVTVVDQLRRQLGALDVIEYDEGSRSTLSRTGVIVSVGASVVGGLVALLTFERAVDGVRVLIHVLVPVRDGGLPWADLASVVVFFVAFGVAARAVDRLVITGVRRLFGG